MATVTETLNETMRGSWWFAHSSKVAIADTLVLTGIDPTLPRFFVGVKMYVTDAEGEAQIVATAGTFTVDVKTYNTGVFEAALSVDATAPETLNFAANATELRVVPNAVSGNSIGYFEVVLTANEK
jgi:hypothetical protein